MLAAANRFDAARAGDVVATFNRSDSDGQVIQVYRSGTQVGSVSAEGGDSMIVSGGSAATSGGGLLFHGGVGKVLPARNTASIDATIDLGQASRRFKDIYISGGIDFSSSSPSPNTGASASNNLLDDYEEGTWTPTLLNGGTIHNTHAATYTKVGRLIHFNLYFNISTPNNAGTFAIGGLPYTPNGGGNNFTTVSMGYYGTGNLQVAQNGIVHASQNYIYFHRADGTSATVKNSMMYANGWSSSNGFIVSGCFVHA